MQRIKYLWIIAAVAAGLVCAPGSLEASSRKAKKFFKTGEQAELLEKWDEALEAYEKAMAEEPGDAAYRMAVRRARFQAGQMHIRDGRKIRREGKFEEALAEFQKAYAIDPSSDIAEQELRETYRMIQQRNKEKEDPQATGEAGLTAAEQARQEADKRAEALLPVPELRPISGHLNTLKMNNQPAKVLFETVGKVAGINVIFDPDFQAPPKNHTVDLTNATLEEALNYLAIMTKTYWKPLSENTIFVTNDNVTKRRDYEDMVVQVFYLKNVTKVQELQEIATAVRSVTDIRRLFTYNAQNAVLVRGTRDQVALAEKLIRDLDKPLAEVVVDVIVMEANRTNTRKLAAAIVSASGANGIQFPVSFSPRSGITNGDGEGGSTGTGIRLGNITDLGINDWVTSLPGMLLEALLNDTTTRILQRPQLRAADGQKASLRLGDRIPYATGSFQPGVGTVGVSPLVSTQFQFADIGVNVDLTPKVHGGDEVSLHLEIDISTERGRIDVGGLEQPIFGQRKVAHDIRIKDGEVTLISGLAQDQVSRSKSGVPGLGEIPIIKWLGFSASEKTTGESDLLIALVPHIVRRPEITELNLRGVAAGMDQVVQLRYAPREAEEPAVPEAEPAEEPAGPGEPVAPDAAEAAPAKPESPEAAGAEAAQGGTATLRFNPPAVEIRPGQMFLVSLIVDGGTDIYHAPMKFKFDPAVVRLISVSEGGLLSGDGQQVIFTRNILNDSGDASIVQSRLPGAGGMSGAGALVVLNLQAVAPGEATLTVSDLDIKNSRMEGISAAPPSLPITVQQ